MFKCFLLFIYFFTLTQVSTSKRIALGKIYRSIESKYFCFRRLNATHQFGCQSDFSGSIGVLHLVNSHSSDTPTVVDEDDVSFITSKGATPPYIPVVSVDLLSTKLMESFRDSGRVSGVIVIKRNNTNLNVFSPDKSCPNDEYGLYSSLFNRSYSDYDHCKKQEWNNPTNNPVSELFYRDFSFPALLIEKEDDIVNIEECISKYGVTKANSKRSWPLCSAELFVRMNAAKDSKTCMRRNNFNGFQFDSAIHYCDPLGSYNIFNPLIPIVPSQPVPDKSLIVLASRLDSYSIFFDKTPGADSPITGLVTILSIAETLGKIRARIESNRKSNRNLLISLFNGESFDYIGSGRTAYDLKNKALQPLASVDFKKLNITTLTLDQLANFIELEQLAPHSSEDLYLHTDPISTNDPETERNVDDLIANLQSARVISFNRSPPDYPLPPASFQSFLRENIKLPGVVISNHNGTYENKYYNSIADDYKNIKFNRDSKSDDQIVRHLTSISTQMSQSIYKMLTDETDPTIESDPQTITDLLYCLVIDASCPLFAKHGFNISSSQFDGINTLPLYVSVRQVTSNFFLISLIAQILATFTGILHEVDLKQCDKLKKENQWLNYHFIQGLSSNGTCVESQVFVSEAVSPVFIEDEPDWSLPYSTWTESVWDSPTIRIFLQPGPNQEWFTLTGGILITLLSFIIVRFLRNQSKTLFKLPSDNGVSLMRETGVDC
ncbi:nicastrin-like [Panonychus citri]|uniref:nicastrin-like n=1 Tax=Panonychus citri TaxID=50023 RepID=UPI00230718A5|nr:nicastrin-like [Panonychus citri]